MYLCPFDDELHPKVAIDKQEAVGGNGGYFFDSGCNLFGLRKVHVNCGPFDWNNKHYASTIKRIFLEFERPTHSQQGKYLSPSYVQYAVYGDSATTTFEIDADDSIVRIDVWASDDLVNAVQFYLKSGLVSELYGAPYIYGSKLTSFVGKNPDSKLVGVHGRFGGVIDKLGFNFASLAPDKNGFPPLPVDSDDTKSTVVTEDVSTETDEEGNASWDVIGLLNNQQ